MIRALLDGRKTQARMCIKSVGGIGPVTEFHPTDTPGYDWIFRDKRLLWNYLCNDDLLSRCPYGVPGDRLWVRETWGVHLHLSGCKPSNLPDMTQDYFGVSYRATPRQKDIWVNRWRRSTHMPRRLSRITLEVVDVRVERVNAISRSDVRAEGAITEEWDEWREDAQFVALPYGSHIENEIDVFESLWDSINGKKPGRDWASNPWVWVVEFKVVP
jgi:hypothetical protein